MRDLPRSGIEPLSLALAGGFFTTELPGRPRTILSVQFSSVTQLCLTVCDPMDCSMPGLPVHHQLLELTQIHVHWVDDVIQTSHPLSSPFSCLQSFPTSGSFPRSQFFVSGCQSIGASASVLPMNIQDLFPLGLTCLVSLPSLSARNYLETTTTKVKNVNVIWAFRQTL